MARMKVIDYSVGDKVRVIFDADKKIKKMGSKGPGWSEFMADCIGNIGKITEIEIPPKQGAPCNL